MKKTWIVIAIVAVVLIGIGGSCSGTYNTIVTLNESLQTSWAQVENVYQRRFDLIPNLVATVQGAANFEKSTLTAVTEARASVGRMQIDPSKIPDKDALARFEQAQSGLGNVLSRLMVVAEKYPELQSNKNFLALQDELAGTENRIAVERMRYNEAVKAYNVYVRRFPNNFMASLFGYTRENAYFKADEGAKRAPVVNFGTPPAETAPAAPTAPVAPTPSAPAAPPAQ